ILLLQLARMMLLFVLYAFCLNFIKNAIILQGWLASNERLMQRRCFFKRLRYFMRANLKFCVVLVILVFAETYLILTPPLISLP
ncbi:TPA: hypothetical protein ACH27H_004684, partial [Escherichia coli]